MNNNPYEVFQIGPSSWRIEENWVRSFLFAGTEKALLIDTGFGTGSIEKTVSELTDLPLMVVNTHADWDHTACNSHFEKAYMHPAEYDRYRYGAGKGLCVEPLWEGDRIDIGGRAFEVILIPGHTPGSIALLDAENRILIAGDSIQDGTIYMFDAGRNIRAYIESMKKLASMSSRFDVVYPSHGTFPLGAGFVDDLIVGAEKILGGKIEGTKAEQDDITAKLYDVGVAKFLYEE